MFRKKIPHKLYAVKFAILYNVMCNIKFFAASFEIYNEFVKHKD
jgi:hypothetical protein